MSQARMQLSTKSSSLACGPTFTPCARRFSGSNDSDTGRTIHRSDAALSEQKLARATERLAKEIQNVKDLMRAYTDRYGQRITHGEAEFNAESLLRLAGWQKDDL